VPQEVGNYTLVFNFPGETKEGNYYTPQSATTHLTVQQKPIQNYPTPPLPTSYWSCPIYAENRLWYTISGNWLEGFYNNSVNFNPDTTAPSTAHIVWAREQYQIAGLVGGSNTINPENGAAEDYYEGPIYQNYFVPPLIISGNLYYYVRASAGNAFTGVACVDLSTGNQLWFDPASVIGNYYFFGSGLLGQIFNAEGANGAGDFAYLWSTGGENWTVLDANTGAPIFTVYNVYSPGPFANTQWLDGGVDASGSLIIYYIDPVAGQWMLKWNSTLMMLNAYGGFNGENIYSPPYQGVVNWADGIQWNVTLPYLGGVQSFGIAGTPGVNNGVTYSDGTVLFTTTATILNEVNNLTVGAYSCQTGKLLWSSNFSKIYVPGSNSFEFWGPLYDGVMTVYIRQLRQWYGYNELTGAYLWGPVTLPEAWDEFTSSTAAYGDLFCGTYGGNIYCINIKNGTLEWTYHLPSAGINNVYGDYPLLGGLSIADGKIYAAVGEHTPENPFWQGAAMYCVNASTGDEIYQISGWWNQYPEIADGYAVSENCLNGEITCFGKGQTVTTVTAPNTQVTLGQSIVISGTVMDDSPGLMDYAGNHLWKADSTPAIGDAYMTQWMQYLYDQKPEPTNATGVPVTLTETDVNHNTYTIGTTTSDISGTYAFDWAPPISGNYTIVATFGGSHSYYGSCAETHIYVSPAPATPAPTVALPTGLASTASLELGIAAVIIVMIVCVAVLTVLMLRKRP
jgi:hypothetical protein